MSGDERIRHRLTDFVKAEAADKGFDLCRITGPDSIPQAPARLADFLAAGYHGTMDWMAETEARRADPRVLWSDVRSVILFGMNYGPEHDPRDVLAMPDRAAISVYAQNRDYHDIIKGKLKEVATRFAARGGADVKVFVDTAPVMEKPLAAAAGLGWQGKHTNLVSRTHGSWLFLGSLFTTADLFRDEPERDHCGSCRACLDACPTDAFPAPYKIDARRCISYLTIEHKGTIDPEFREKIGNRIYGCDDCLAACPWNKFAASASEMKLKARDELKAPAIADLLTLDDPGFRAHFSGSPVKRIGRDRFVRNVLIAAGNSGDRGLIARCAQLADDTAPVVRGMAAWALSRLMTAGEFEEFAAGRADDADADVRAEYERAKADCR
ncbi:tRNA epoxyqueuosine(34) reductase QueG [Shinella sp. CPCC 100929]|uniref:Epoxyqueuosine reductase n=1 Tax=Shinella lacus TaxID=2654216 RepID=A0ABT1R8X6_9HYPH|nr:tRNA epoxyqueuosine(34) reductase QueG [Shinella lacus]MCQ4631534.1 tRNA epoxyqueuosine(34) reductase QueG [Shinella lacus]